MIAVVPTDWKDTLKPRPRRSDTIERVVRLPSERSAHPGPYRFEGREYLREIVDSVDEHEVREIVFIAGTQIGKSELVRAILLSQRLVDNAPALLVGSDADYAREFKDQCFAVGEASPELAPHLAPEHERNDRYMDFGGAPVYLGWSGSSQRMSGRPCKLTIGSEVDRFTKTPHLLRQRGKAFWNSTVLFEGTLIGGGVYLWKLYKDGCRREYHVPCPTCGHYQELRCFPHREGPYAGRGGLVGLREANGAYKQPEDARRDAVYLCEHGCKIDPAKKSWMIARGFWCPRGCEVVDGELVGTPEYRGDRRSYRLPSIYSPTISFGDLAAEACKVQGDEAAKCNFFNDWLALPYLSRGRTPRHSELGHRLKSTYRRCTVPERVCFLTLSVDVQDRESYALLMGWGEHRTCWIIDWQVFQGEGGTQLDPLVDLLNREFPVAGTSVVGVYAMKAVGLAIDAGWKPAMVAAFQQRVGDPRITIVRGAGRDLATAYKLRLPDEDVHYKYYRVNTPWYKEQIHSAWKLNQGDPGAWSIPDVPDEDSELLLRQFTNEELRAKVDQSGHVKEVWTVIDNSLRSDFFDCAVYGSMIADLLVEKQWVGVADRLRQAYHHRPAPQPERSQQSFIRQPGANWLKPQR